MAEVTAIAWTDSTFNPWIGCTEVGPGCDHCYARELDKRHKWGGAVHWGPGVPRYRTSENLWKQPLKWNEKAKAGLLTWRVFCASLADVFDNEVPREWRKDLVDLILRTPNLSWLLVTKRIGNVARMIEDCDERWIKHGFPDNVRLLITVCDQEEADRDIPKLLALPCKNGLSMEPLLGPVDLSCWLKGQRGEHDEEREGVSIAAGDRRVFRGQGGQDMEASTAHSREPHRDAAILEASDAKTGGVLEVGRLSDGDVLGRRDSQEGVRSSGRLDGAEASGHPARHGSESRERETRRHGAEQPHTDDAIAERNTRHPGIGPQAARPNRGEEPFSTADGGTGSGHSRIERQDGAVATRGDVRSDAGNNLGRRNQKDLEAPSIGWVIVGGESTQGAGKARPFDLEWARSTITQCKAAGVPAFMKQIGSPQYGIYRPPQHHYEMTTAFPRRVCLNCGSGEDEHELCSFVVRDRAGADPAEWPEDLRVQEFPA